MRLGTRIAVDLGDRRIGVARSDPSGLMGVPVTTVTRGVGDVQALVALVNEYEAIELILGLPLTLQGDDGPAAVKVRAFADDFAPQCPCPVRLVDERMSTTQAQRSLHDAGRSVKSSRAIIDQAAAVVILQSALDNERSTGVAPGVLVEVDR
ncbi:MAG: Holliday junction resolvase RuvX [Actinomycetes bacterium]